MKIGLFGGSFDPPHSGHVAAARVSLERAGLAAVVFMPASVSPLKIGRMRASAADRLEMLRLALAGEPCFSISDFELRRPAPSFTIDTVRHFRAENPEDELHLILGADSFETLPLWKDADEIARLCKFIVLARSGCGAADAPQPERIIINDFAFPVSSTEIRRRAAAREALDGFLPARVAEYIQRHGLYAEA